MKHFFLGCLFIIVLPVFVFSQSIFENSITGINPNQSNPYTTGQLVNPNITVSGIGRCDALNGVNANNRYDAKSWKLVDSGPETYFEFNIIPNKDRQINFVSFVYTGQISANGPTLFAFRSSVDDFRDNIGTVVATGATVSLSADAFQGITTPITFRLYGWDALAGTGTFSINDFQFNGNISCEMPQTPVLPELSLDCTSTSFVLNWPVSLHASKYYIDVAADSGFVDNLQGYQNKDLGNTLTETVGGLIPGEKYYVRMKSANGCAVSTYSNSIKVAPPETIYDGSWSNGIPDRAKNIRFSKNFKTNETLEGCSCQIDPQIDVEVNSEGVLILQNGLNIHDSATLIFENNANLVQVNDAAINSGQIIYKRETAPMKDFDYTYWSSPVKDQVLNVLSPNTLSDKYFSFANGDWVYENGSSKMNPAGKGFIIRVPKPDTRYPNGEYWTGSSYSQQVNFKGVPNNGIVKILSQGIDMDNLIGNPYPSAVDADAFIMANTELIGGALNFWTHNTAIKQNGAFYVYNSDDYASYNLTGGTAAAPSTGGLGVIPNGKIAAGVSFFVKSRANGDFVFNNSMRNAMPGSNNQFFRNSNTKKRIPIEKNRLWLNLTNSEGAFKQLLVGYITGATNEIDNLYDGTTFDGNAYIDFYSISKENKLVIQGRALPIDKKDKVLLGYKTTIPGTFQIGIDKTDGVLTNLMIFIKDNVTKVFYNLKEGNYVFTSDIGIFDDRFTIVYESINDEETQKGSIEPPVSSLDSTLDRKEKSVIVSSKDHCIKINTFGNAMTKVMLYDLRGRLLYENMKINSDQFVSERLNFNNQCMIVTVLMANGNQIAKEIIF